jgi:protocatechuate 3,4-dioxygenase beta subunit
VVAPKDEPGPRLVVSGVVYQADGVTSAPGVLLYIWHTDATGRYTRRGDETGNGLRHGRLRGWMRTDEQGRYQFETIRPAAYPNQEIAAHIHATLTPPGGVEGYIEDYLFADDPLVSERETRRSGEQGRFGAVLVTTRSEDGVLRAQRDLRLPGRTEGY